jgi:hypothetical protein
VPKGAEARISLLDAAVAVGPPRPGAPVPYDCNPEVVRWTISTGLIERIEQVTAEPPSGGADRHHAAPREPERGPRPSPGRDRSGDGYLEAAAYKGVTSTARRGATSQGAT